LKILLFYDYSGNLGDAIRISRIISFLEKEGHSVVKCNMNDYYRSKKKLASSIDFIVEMLKNSRYVTDRKIFQNKVYLGYGAKILSEIIKKEKPEVVITESIKPSFIATLVDGRPVHISDIHGLASSEYKENEFIKEKSEKYAELLDNLEYAVFKKSDYLLVVSESMGRYIIKNFKTEGKKIISIPNGADIQKNTAKYSKDCKIVYGGIFAFWEDVDSYLDLAEICSDAQFYILGGGPLKEHVMKRIEDENINIDYLGYMKKDKSLSTFAEMNIGVAPSTKNVTREVACPIKVFDYMACGLPVITADCGDWAKIIKKHDCGIVTRKSDGKEFNIAVEKLKNKEVWQKKSRNAIATIRKHYNWDMLLKPLGKLLSELEKK